MGLTNLMPEGYVPRIVDGKICRYLETFGAVEVAGTKWCGKTWTALSHGESVSYVDDAFEIAKADPAIMTLGEQPHVIDEWQLVPAIRDVVRRKVDEKRSTRGAWILTGSSSPLDFEDDDAPRHSGAGRIGKVRMFPMSLAESHDSARTVSLKGLFDGRFAPGMLAEDAKDARSLVRLTCKGGWPEALEMDEASSQAVAREYLRALFEETAPRHGLSSDLADRLLTSVSRTIGQAATQRTLYEDMTGERSEKLQTPQKVLLTKYLRFFKDVYVMEEVPGWVPPTRSPKRLSIKPKRYLADPSLVVAQLGMGVESLIGDWQTFGTVFENMCMRDVLVYALAHENAGRVPVRYYRDDSGLEIDAIVELSDGRWCALEFKTSEDKVDDGISNLKRLKNKLCENPLARVRPPEFMAVIVGLSMYAREADEGIYVIPLRALCP